MVVLLTAAVFVGAQIAPPSNDTFENAEVIAGPNGYLQGTNINASIEPGEPTSCDRCATVWYRWTAPANLSMTFETVMYTVTPDNYLTDTVIGVYSGGNVAKLQMLALNDNVSVKRNNRRSRVTLAAEAGQTYNIRIYGNAETQGLFLLQWDINGAESWKQYSYDGCTFFGQRKSDFGVFRPSDNVWWISLESPQHFAMQWGQPGDTLVPGDYFGDGCSDIAIFRPDGTWWIYDPIFNESYVNKWGMAGDIPVRGDFDGDDIADLAIWRRSGTPAFWILNSSDGSVSVIKFGYGTDTPVCSDYDGDGKTDLATKYHPYGPSVFRILRSSDQTVVMVPIGVYNDYPVAGDFDRDGKGDIATFGTEFPGVRIILSSSGTYVSYAVGKAGDIPVSGDYTGNPGSDVCFWRPSNATLYCIDGITNEPMEFRWGLDGDIPIAGVTEF
jgi:hypothetical protein